MIRVPSTGNVIAKAKSVGDLRSLCNATAISEASTMLTATATIVTASASIADSSQSTVALIGAVASMIGASASLLGQVSAVAAASSPTVDVVQIVERVAGSGCKGLTIQGLPALSLRKCRRADLRILADVDRTVSIGDCTWDAPGPDGVYVNGTPEAEYLRDRCLDGLDILVVGTGSFEV
jgi:hypothetical protein